MVQTLVLLLMLGGIIYYRLTEIDAAQINRRRTTGEAIARRIAVSEWPLGAQAHIGNAARVGQVFPMLVVRICDPDPFYPVVNGQVFLDGCDNLWVQNIAHGDAPGQYAPSY